MAHAQKPDFIFRRNVQVHLNRRGRQLIRLLAAEVCASAIVILDTRSSAVVKRNGYPLHSPLSPSLPLPYGTVCHHVSTGLYSSGTLHSVTTSQHSPPPPKSLSLWKPKMSRMASPLYIHSWHSYFDRDFKYKEWHVHKQTLHVICRLPLRTHTFYFLQSVFTVNITQTGSVVSTGASLLRVSEHQLTIYNGSHFSEGRTVNFQTNCMSQWWCWTLDLQLIIFTSLGYSENVSINFFGQLSILNCIF